MRRRLTVLTVGCKASFADSASIIREAAAAGFDVVSPGQPADVVFINGCTVTHRADRDNRALARRARRRFPDAVLVMSGCWPAVAADSDRRALPEVDHWLPGGGERRLALLERLAGEPHAGTGITDFRADRILGHKRTFLKIQDGCDCRCAYCIVPIARGPHRSLPADEIVRRAVESEREGAGEFLLTGIHIGRYGSDRQESDGLARLVRRILGATTHARIRLGSVEPLELTASLLSIFRETSRVCPHLHVPMQSGSDTVLARMRRPYSRGQFLEAVAAVRDSVPSARIGADVMVGFPGESADDFRDSVEAIGLSGIDYLHVFPYSVRSGTESSGWPDDVPSLAKKERAAEMNALDARLRARFLERMHGRTLTVFVRRHDRGGHTLTGVSEYGVDVSFPGTAGRIGR
ncbi:MAG TPA: MiaB/RimO family radical SAM methylthiotransferase, partial [Candidatus Deferrimicrobiaceae bacterium]